AENKAVYEKLTQPAKSYHFVKTALVEIKDLMQKGEKEQAKALVSRAIMQIENTPKEQQGTIHLVAYLHLLEQLQPYKDELNISIAFDTQMLDRVFDNEQEFYHELLDTMKLSSETTAVMQEYIVRLITLTKEDLKKGAKSDSRMPLIKELQSDAKVEKIPLLIGLEMLKTVQLDKIFDLSYASKIKASYLILIAIPSYGGMAEKYYKVSTAYGLE
ncbi:MAG: hypothetical protein JXQ76_02555, partial [Campylobacterales bacterium]|nr:hypothetical protein [Campylobacterales bacterium]